LQKLSGRDGSATLQGLANPKVSPIVINLRVYWAGATFRDPSTRVRAHFMGY
jgi:hypothetical protein